jgi:hypothetical protein
MTIVRQESKRVKRFRLEIAKQIPKVPNDKHTLALLESRSLANLLIVYVNWAVRLIPPRPRNVTIAPTLTADARWKSLAPATRALLDRVRRGDDLTPYLSLRAIKNGFCPAAAGPNPTADKWEDKDFILNVMGYHHLHLSQVAEPKDHFGRTDDVLFAEVTRQAFTAIAFFDHTVFDFTDPLTGTMTAERARLWKLYDERQTALLGPNQAYVPGPITTSGHTLHGVRLADHLAGLVHAIDPQLDELSSRSKLFKDMLHDTVKRMKLKWHLNCLDLGLIDSRTKTFYILHNGPT